MSSCTKFFMVLLLIAIGTQYQKLIHMGIGSSTSLDCGLLLGQQPQHDNDLHSMDHNVLFLPPDPRLLKQDNFTSTKPTFMMPQHHQYQHQYQHQYHISDPDFLMKHGGHGGVVVFLHIAKTGGTSIRNTMLEQFNHSVKFARLFGVDQVELMEPLIRRFLRGRALELVAAGETAANQHLDRFKTTLFIELHGHHGDPAPGILTLHSYLQRWRRIIDQQQTHTKYPLFVFTMIRNPISFHVSYYNYFRNANCTHTWCDPPLFRHLQNETNLLSSVVPNHQSMYLIRQYDYNHAKNLPLTQPECQALYSLLWNDLDWIGTTEHSEQYTWPIVHRVLQIMTTTTKTTKTTKTSTKSKSSSTSYNHPKSNTTTTTTFVSPLLEKHNVNTEQNKLHVQDLSKHAIQVLEEASQCDQFLYNRVQEHFENKVFISKLLLSTHANDDDDDASKR